jgi:DNA-binding CsgD family transcriptional regulator
LLPIWFELKLPNQKNEHCIDNKIWFADIARETEMANSMEMRYREEFSRQQNLIGAAQLLAESATELGWDLAAFNIDREINMPNQSDGSFIGTAMGWPMECTTTWLDKRMANHCPVTQKCGRVTDSFSWTCDSSDTRWSKTMLSAQQCEVLAHMGRFIDGATTVPVHRPGGKTGYVSWFLRDGRKLDELHGKTYEATYLISHNFIRRADELGALHRQALLRGNKAPLTPREIECLTWAANGKTEEDIGMIIERSRETARFHLRNSVQKLNAINRTHAVAIACSQGMINVF